MTANSPPSPVPTTPLSPAELEAAEPEGARDMTDPSSETTRMRVIPAVSPEVFRQTIAAYQAEHPTRPLTPEQIYHARALPIGEQFVETVTSVTGRPAMLDLLARTARASGGRTIGLGLSKIAASFLAEGLRGAPASLTHSLEERCKARTSPGQRPAEFALGPGDVLFLHDAHVATAEEREALIHDAARSGALVRLTGSSGPTAAGPTGAVR
ncbi:AAA family ATPase [Streptomyces bobili]|uniref:AAA family ATPase n=1 Tax=Streptomyces bobili TaxID=67280 RepID=UPI003420F9E6